MTGEQAEITRRRILNERVLRFEVEVDKGTYDIAREHLGYFGVIQIISIGGKKTVVKCDPRDAVVVPMLEDWYDDVVWAHGCIGKWDPDTRFMTSPNPYPVLVEKDGKWAMIGYYGVKHDPENNPRGTRSPYYGKWYDHIDERPRRQELFGTWTTVFDAIKDGKPVMLTTEGVEVVIDPKVTLDDVKDWTKDDIVKKWIEVGRPCTMIRGFSYKGAKPYPIGREEALRRIKAHSFGKGYYSMEWTVFEGKATLQFSEYSESDML